MKHSSIVTVFGLAGILLVLGVAALVWVQVGSASSELPAEAGLTGVLSPLYDKPVHNWRVCADLGVGMVPGLGIRRQRFRLCHNSGWRVLAYCMQTNRPAPRVGARCSRTGEETYWCGSGVQNLREYRVEDTPVPTPTQPVPTGTPTSPTPTPTQTASQTPMPGPPRQARPGGPGFAGWLFQTASDRISELASRFSAEATPTATPVLESAPSPEASLVFNGIDFGERSKRIRILIFPPDKRVNKGKPITISFVPGKRCQYSDHRGCVTAFQDTSGAPVTFLSVHSGVGGEGQALRHALEGTSLRGAGFPLSKVLANLEALDGAEVVITQGKKSVEGFTLEAVSRIPPKWVNDYLEQSMDAALPFATALDPALSLGADPNLPLLLFETCGWRISGERGAVKVPATSASIYLGVIQMKP